MIKRSDWKIIRGNCGVWYVELVVFFFGEKFIRFVELKYEK